MKPHVDGTRVVDVSDPELFEYPIVYATEPGFMELSDTDAAAMREYLMKGGFVIFDDSVSWGTGIDTPLDFEPC